MEQIKRFTEDLHKLRFVSQSGGKNAKVLYDIIGYEGIAFNSIIFNKKLAPTRKGVINVFDTENNLKWLGCIKYENEERMIPSKYKADEELYFKDFYTEG